MGQQDDDRAGVAFAVALSQLYVAAGKPKYEWLREKTGVPTSSLDDWLKGRSVPSAKSRRQLRDVVAQLQRRAVANGHPQQRSWEWWEGLRQQAELVRRTKRGNERATRPPSRAEAPPSTRPPRLGIRQDRHRVQLALAAALALTVGVAFSLTRCADPERNDREAEDPATHASSEADASAGSSSLSGPPVTVAAVRIETPDGHDGWVSPNVMELTASEALSVDSNDGEWFRQHGAVDAGASYLQIVLEGNRETPVRILDMRPIMDCSAPLDGTLFLSPPAGVDGSVRIGFDLDEPEPVPRIVEDYEWQGDYFSDNTVSLAHEEQQTFQITTTTEEQYCEYTLELTVLDDNDEIVTQEISDNGDEPFRVTSMETGDFGEPGAYSHYEALYLGGVQVPDSCGTDVEWVRQDPQTWTDSQPVC